MKELKTLREKVSKQKWYHDLLEEVTTLKNENVALKDRIEEIDSACAFIVGTEGERSDKCILAGDIIGCIRNGESLYTGTRAKYKESKKP